MKPLATAANLFAIAARFIRDGAAKSLHEITIPAVVIIAITGTVKNFFNDAIK